MLLFNADEREPLIHLSPLGQPRTELPETDQCIIEGSCRECPMSGPSPAGCHSNCSRGPFRYPTDETTPSYSQSSRILPSNCSHFATSIRSVMINHSLDSCDSPSEEEPTLSSVGPFLVKGASFKVVETLDFDPSLQFSQGARCLARF